MTALKSLAGGLLLMAPGLMAAGPPAWAQDSVPASFLGEYAIGSCGTPDASVLIESDALTIYDGSLDNIITIVEVESVSLVADGVVMDVVIDGTENGVMEIAPISGGDVEVFYTPNGGSPEAPQALTLCAAADPSSTPPSQPLDDVFTGLFALGSCAAPDQLVDIGPNALQVIDPADNQTVATATVQGIESMMDGQRLLVDFEGSDASIELRVVDGGVEIVFIDNAGNAEQPEVLEACDGPAVSPPTDALAALPDGITGDYATGSCAAPDVLAELSGTHLYVEAADNGEVVVDADLYDIVATANGYAAWLTVDGIEMEVRFDVVSADELSIVAVIDGQAEPPEALYRCAPTVVEPSGTILAELPAFLTGDFVTGSCDEPDARISIGPNSLTALDAADDRVILDSPVSNITELPGGIYEATVTAGGQPVTLELVVLDEQRAELTATYADGQTEPPEILFSCGPVAQPPVATLSQIPSSFHGEWAIGTCDAAVELVRFEANQLVLVDPETGEELLVALVEQVVETPTGIELTATFEGEPQTLRFNHIDESTLEGIRIDANGDLDNPEYLNLCGFDQQQGPVSQLSAIPSEFQGHYAVGACFSDGADDQQVEIFADTFEISQGGELVIVADVLGVSELSDGISVDLSFGNDNGTLEMRRQADGNLETSFYDGDGVGPDVEVLIACGDGAINPPPDGALAQMPDELVGIYAIGACEDSEFGIVIYGDMLDVLSAEGVDETITFTALAQTNGGVMADILFGDGSPGRMQFAPNGAQVEMSVWEGADDQRPQVFDLTSCDEGPTDIPQTDPLAELPATYVGTYAVGACGDGDLVVDIHPDRIEVIESGELSEYVEIGQVYPADLAVTADVLLDGDEPGTMEFTWVGDVLRVTIWEGENDDRPQSIELVPCDEGPEISPQPLAALPSDYRGSFSMGPCGENDVMVEISDQLIRVFEGGELEEMVEFETILPTEDGVMIDVVFGGNEFGQIWLAWEGDVLVATIYEGDNDERPQTIELTTCDAGPIVDPIESGLLLDSLPGEFQGTYGLGPCGEDEFVQIYGDRIEVFLHGSLDTLIDFNEITARDDGTVDIEVTVEGEIGRLELAWAGEELEVTVWDSLDDDRPALEVLTPCTEAVVEPTGELLDRLPDAFQGSYAIGPCGGDGEDDLEVTFFSDRLEVTVDGEYETAIDFLAIYQTEDGVTVNTVDEDGMPAVVQLTWIEGGTILEVSARSEASDEPEVERLTPCDDGGPVGPVGVDGASVESHMFDEPAARFGEMVSVLGVVCVAGSEQACVDTFWGFADLTGDGRLTHAELARVTRFGAKWTIAENAPVLDLGQKTAVHLATMLTGPVIATGLIANYDYDDDNAISQIELFPDGIANAPVTINALVQAFSEDTLDSLGDAIEDMDRLF